MPKDSARINDLVQELALLPTEATTLDRGDLDLLSTPELITLMNTEDAKVPAAVAAVTTQIARAVDEIVDRMQRGGRLFYLGAGTAGRIGILDASECPPTFGTPPELVVGLIAGGTQAIQTAIEDSEDDTEAAAIELQNRSLTELDTVVGISASGRTPYVLGGLSYAQSTGSLTVALSSNAHSEIGKHADITIETLVGPEFIAGSTRLKSGTAQKLVLNMLSTLTMVRLGKTFNGVMVDLRATNAKLRARSIRTVVTLTGTSLAEATSALEACQGSVKQAVLVILSGVDPKSASQVLEDAQGILRVAIESASADHRDPSTPKPQYTSE